MQKSSVWMVLIVLFMSSLLVAGTDFSGNWTLDTSKSDFGSMPGPNKMTWKATHSDPNLSIAWMLDGSWGLMEGESKYLTNGEPTTNSFGEMTITAKAKWEGSTLRMNSQGELQGSEFSFDDKWELSEDGETLTVTRAMSSSMGDITQILVFVKE